MRNIFLPLSVLSVALFFSACNKDNSSPANTANVMFVNACNGSTNIEVKVNGSVVSAASNLAYFSYSGYQSVTSGTGVAVNFYLTALGTPLVSGSPSFTTGSNYSVFAGGIVTSPTFVMASDDLSAPTSGYSKVRFINLSSDTLNESFYIAGLKLDSNVTMGTCTLFFEVAANTSAAVLIQDPLQPTKLAQIASQAFVSGKIYTIMLSGTSTGTGTAILTPTVINNN